jgi:glycosyltransferase involved in cell wall biosynthesis
VRVAVDCHMVGQPEAGDAGNARFHTLLTNALQQTRGDGDHVSALIAHAAARALIDPAVPTHAVWEGNIARLAIAAPRALVNDRADAAIFSYITPLHAPCKLLVVVHDVSFRLHPEWFSRRVRMLLGTLVPRSVRRADLVITVSQTSKADVVAALDIDPNRVRVVSNVPAPAFAPRPDAHARVRERFGLDRYCLYVGDVHPRKNLASLAQAITTLDGPNRLELAIVGRAGHRGDQIITASGAKWLGPLGDDDLADLYSAAAVTCYPSLYEGFGLPVIEAMACGSPVVASNRGAIPEVAGDAAILVEPTPEALADGLRAALEPATADRLRQLGPEQAKHFSPQAMGEAMWSAIREVA